MLYIFLCLKFLGLVMKILPLCELYRINLNGLTKDKTQGYLITQNSSSLHDDIKHLLSRKCIYILYDHPYNYCRNEKQVYMTFQLLIDG